MRKKGIALILGLSMVLAATGCGRGSGEGKTSKSGEITVPEYKGLEVYESEIDVDATMEATIQSILSSKATTEQKDEGKVQETDTVNIDYVGSIDGFEFEGGTGTGYDLDIDNSTFIEGFAEGLVGKKVGKTVDLNLKFPDDYTNSTTDADGNELVLAGQDVLFKVTINYRTVTVTPEYTDDFVKQYYSAVGSTTDEFDAYVKRQLQISNAMSVLWDGLLEDCEVKTYPEGEVESYQTYLSDMYVQQLQNYYQTDLDTYLEACSMSQEDWDNELKESSQSFIKQGLMVDKIAEDEKIKVTKDSENYEQLVLRLAQLNGLDSVEALEQSYTEDVILSQLNYEAVQGLIFDNIKIMEGERPTEAETEAEETTAAAE